MTITDESAVSSLRDLSQLRMQDLDESVLGEAVRRVIPAVATAPVPVPVPVAAFSSSI